ncbi:hypothetical protein B0H10DRAFT_1811297 [Mycena sp. CBHHK59/15]|nr:hypothetical protein B0H10DRAFT_1811297 [Mycena sp. CBHHK59/15]
MHQTPWTKKASSIPSDRIRPASQPASNVPKNSKGKSKGAAAVEPPKSKAVRQLESVRNGLTTSSGNGKDPQGGCFCQAREHSLSTYAALCRACGLILCSTNLPQFACPHCSTPLLTGSLRDSLVARLESQISETLAKEALLRDRAVEEARRAAGAFPTLANPGGAARGPPPPPQTRTVMSLNSKTKKVMVSSFTTPSPSPSRPASRAESVEEEPTRAPRPPTEVPFAVAAKLDPLRPWKDLSGGGATYVPAPSLDDGDEARGAVKKRRRGKGKAKENDNGSSNMGPGEGSAAPPTIVG